MNNTIAQRLSQLREEMEREHLAAVIIPTSDPHQSEYTAAHWKGRAYISGFDGSAGTAVVTMNGAALWTDSRYFLAAEEQLKDTEFQLMKLKVDGTPTIAEWIGKSLSTLNTSHSTEVAIDGMVASASEVRQLREELRSEGGLTLRTNIDLLGRIWRNRPPVPLNPVELYPEAYAGESCASKLQRIRQELRRLHADGMLMASLDDIAWTLNLRGTDVHCTPVFVSYLLVSSTSATLFINKEKLSPQVEEYLRQNGIGTDDYGQVARGLSDYAEYNILLDPNEVSHTLFSAVQNDERRGTRSKTVIVEHESPVKRMKTVKNAVEQQGLRNAMLRDGVAMVQFLCWLDKAMGATGTAALSECSVSEKLLQLRAAQPLFRDISFDTIAAYGVHGAIVHYEPTPESNIPLQREGLLLLDSGAQYMDGTTDITRTIALGPLTEEMRRVYTLVLKGHIQIELARFPEGISGTQLDVLAKRAMWQEGYSYLHGTGHGVGTYLSVHEGPHQIRMEWKPAPLVEGMTVTDEPGIYLAGRFGVRIENTLLIVPAKPRSAADPMPADGKTECGRFLQFESLTLCPIDKRPILPELLSDEERQWLDGYHRLVLERLSPLLADDEQQWLKEACAPV